MTHTARSAIQVAMNGNISVYRVRIWEHENPAFIACLHRTSMPGNCIRSIVPKNGMIDYDVKLSEDDLVMVKLAVSLISADWMYDWIDAKL